MSKRLVSRAASVAASAVVVGAASAAFAQVVVPGFNISLGYREGTTAAPVTAAIGAASGATGSIKWLNPTGIRVAADGTYADLTFKFGTDATTAFTTVANSDAAGALGALEHIRIMNTEGVIKPTSLWVDDVISTPAGGSPVTITDFQTIPSAIANNTANVLVRDPTISGSTSQNFARNFQSSIAVDAQPDGTTDATKRAGRINFRFSTPEIVNATTGWGRATTASSPAITPVLPTIATSAGSTLTMRVAIVVNEPLYGYVGFNGDNAWINNDNWGHDGGVNTNTPNSATATALFDETVAEGNAIVPRTVTVDAGDVKVQNLQFDTAVPYTISGANQILLTRSATDVSPTITVAKGNQTISAPLKFTGDGTAGSTTGFNPLIWVSPGASLTVTSAVTVDKFTGTTNTLDKRGGGTATLAQDLDVSTLRIYGGEIGMGVAASSTLGNATFGNSAQNLAGGTLRFDPASGVTKTITTVSVVTGGTLATKVATGGDVAVTTMNLGVNSNFKLDLAGHRAVKVGTLGINGTGTDTSVSPTAKLDLTNDGVFLDYAAANTAAATSVRNQILAAYAGGAWTGKGIGSSLLGTAGTANYGVGYRSLANGETFMGWTATDDSAVGIRYTLLGDTNLSGNVNFDDLLALAKNYAPGYDPTTNGAKLWAQGDTNYNGIVDFDDLLALAKNYNGSVAAAGALVESVGGTFASDYALAQSLVPEPTSIAFLGGVALLGLRGRRRA